MNNRESAKIKRVALVIQYLGTAFYGWQRQPHYRSVQEEIEGAINHTVAPNSAGSWVPLHGAGRTDSGVHAAAQVAHFDVTSPIPAEKFATVLNKQLPDEILIRASAQVSPDWHARFSATYRRYRYTLYTAATPNLFVAPWSWHYYYADIEEAAIAAALQPLLGYHDLAAFCRAGSDRTHTWVNVQEVKCIRNGPLVEIEIQADGFLYGMVRLLVGLLVKVGTGELTPEAFAEIWQQQQRDRVKYSAPAKGLCLLRVGYEEFPFPQSIWFNSQPHFYFDTENLL
ncbi:MAG: tRNA pseudouridine(38-40) synthase TruA [Cyanobacteria bacterium]|jgi:tRNA pseudouridine38-40 synthase|nr:tRNA pseudouridine(38-40) synthase TruA [Cyanobacteria bacterium GSL.Bin1]